MKSNGSLALVGSGEYLPQMKEFEQSLINDGIANGKKPIYIQIPTAAGQESDNRINYWQSLGEVAAKSLGVTQSFLTIFTWDDAKRCSNKNQRNEKNLSSRIHIYHKNELLNLCHSFCDNKFKLSVSVIHNRCFLSFLLPFLYQ